MCVRLAGITSCPTAPLRIGSRTASARQLIARGFSVEAVERLAHDATEELVLRFIDDKFAHIATGGA